MSFWPSFQNSVNEYLSWLCLPKGSDPEHHPGNSNRRQVDIFPPPRPEGPRLPASVRQGLNRRGNTEATQKEGFSREIVRLEQVKYWDQESPPSCLARVRTTFSKGRERWECEEQRYFSPNDLRVHGGQHALGDFGLSEKVQREYFQQVHRSS